nr:splicing factor [Tanacetum cinerariifolium]
MYPCGNNVFEVRKGYDSYGVNIDNRTCACKWWDLSGVPCVHSVAAFSFLKNDPILEEPHLPPVLRKMPGRPRKLRIKHVTDRVNVITRSGRMMTCHNCWEKGHNKKGCNKEKQPKPDVEKRAPGRKKAGSNFVFQTCDKDGGDADPSSAGPNVGDPSFAGPSVADSSSAGPSVAYPSSTGPSVADSSSAGPSVAHSTGSGTQSKTSDTAKIIEDAIATESLKTAGLKRRCKSERIAKRAKAFQFGKDGAGSCPDKVWDVDDVLAEK